MRHPSHWKGGGKKGPKLGFKPDFSVTQGDQQLSLDLVWADRDKRETVEEETD